MVYFGSYNIRLLEQYPQDFIDNYSYIFRVNALSSNKLKIIDIMYMNNNYEYLNIDNLQHTLKEFRIIPGMIILYENDIVYFTHPDKGLNSPIKLCEMFKETKYIHLEDLEKIKTNMIKSNKILSS